MENNEENKDINHNYCSSCKKTFSKKSNLNRHMKNVHQEGDVLERFICGQCSRIFTTKAILTRHLKTCGKVQGSIKIDMCPICKIETPELNAHLFQRHHIEVKTEKFYFNSMDEFEQWKKDLEKTTLSKYVRFNSNKIRHNKRFYYYYCHRFGKIGKRGKNIRNQKILGSNQILGKCPSKIIVNETLKGNTQGEKKIEVKFVKTHAGHEMEIGRIPLSKEDRISLATKIAQKIPFDEVLNSVRDTITEENFDRFHLLTRKDLFNIEQSFNLNKNSVRHGNDCTSVRAWVEQNKEHNGNRLIRFYKNQGELSSKYPELQIDDFLLVIMSEAQLDFLIKFGNDCLCIDSTHGLNKYNFELTTLLVLDDLRQGLPCLFAFSNRSGTFIFKIVFSILREVLNQSDPQNAPMPLIKPKVFMSDMAECFYSAWLEIMGPVKFRLYCTWHVDKAWKKNVLSKIKSKEGQDYVYKMLRILLVEQDEYTFEEILKKILSELEQHTEFEEFRLYFEKQYVPCKKYWAYCYRKYAGLNTNMHLENMHRTIKYIYLKGKTVRRLDKAIDAILKFIRDKLVDGLISLNKGKLTSKLSILRQRHKAVASLQNNQSVKQDDQRWLVSSSISNEIYTVQTSNVNCNCSLKCQECMACIHAYICTCPDSSIKANMCKHIHLICQSEKTCISNSNNNNVGNTMHDNDCDTDLNINENPNLREQQDILSHLNSDNISKPTDLDNLKGKLKDNFEKIVQNITTKEHYEIVKKALDPILPTFSALSASSSSSVSFPQVNKSVGKKYIETQRFKSTKRKRKVANTHLAKPTNDFKQEMLIKLVMNENS